MIKRSFEVLLEILHPFEDKMVFLVGPRQVGKTTLSRIILKKRKCEHLYRNWDDLAWRKEFSKNPYGFIDSFQTQNDLKSIIVLDEIHKTPQWKRYLKGLYDTRKERVDIIVTGSGRLDYYQKGGDSLLGRYLQYRMHPLSVRELLDKSTPDEKYTPEGTLKQLLNKKSSTKAEQDTLEKLYTWGGFPEPFVKQNQRFQRLWLKERKRLLVREDLRDFANVRAISNVELFSELIVNKVGSLLSLNSLTEDVGVSQPTLKTWLSYFERLYYSFQIKPYHKNLARSIKRDPKVYLWDWTELDEDGIRMENIIASHLLKWCDFTKDFGFNPLQLYYIRDKEKREVDFLLTKNNKPLLLIEVKSSSTTPTKSLNYFAQRLKIPYKFLISFKKLERNGSTGDVRVMDAASFLGELPV